MQFPTNPTTLVFLVAILICQHGIGYSAKGRRRSTTPSTIMQENDADELNEAGGAMMEIADQNSGEAPVDILDVGLQVAETISSLAPSPVGTILSLGLTLVGMSGGGKDDPYKKIEESLKSMEDASKKRDAQTQSLILEQSEETKGVVIAESARVIEALNEGLRKNDEASKERDARTQFLILETSKKLKGVIVAESFRVIKNLTDTFDSHTFMRDMRRQLDRFEAQFPGNIACLLNSHCQGPAKELVLDILMNPMSDFRLKLERFISDYIEPQHRNLQKQYHEELFFDFLFHDMTEKARDNKDCSTQSTHTEVLKSYMYISKTLTDAYTLVATAHTVRYREYLAINAEPDKITTVVDQSLRISGEYLSCMKSLLTRTKKTLKEAHGEIRKCDPPKSVQGETFDSLNFLKFEYRTSRGMQEVTIEPSDIKYNETFSEDFENAEIHERKNLVIVWCDHPRYNPRNFNTIIDEKGVHFALKPWKGFQRLNRGSHYIQQVSTQLCVVYDKTIKVGFSNRSVEAQPGNVVTGIRWRISKNVIYIDIEEGEFIDGTRVNESTVEWSETPESDGEVELLDEHVKGILLEDVKLESGAYLTGVQMILVNGKLTLSLKGSKTNLQGTKLSDKQFSLQPRKKNYSEFVLNRPDDPKMYPEHSESVVMRDQGKYYINFQPTDVKKTGGRETIPYFDIQEVITDPPVPIGGLGIYHKAVPGYGGFLGLKILSPDYRHMLNEKVYNQYNKIFQIKPKNATSKKT